MNKIKYPKTPYLPWSPSVDQDDPIIDPAVFVGKEICISIKMDGSNIAMTRKGIYGRSEHHPSLNEIKAKHGEVSWAIPEGEHIFGESLVAKHSIHYKGKNALADLYQVFSIYREEDDMFTSVDYIDELCNTTGLTMVTYVLYAADTLDRLEKAIRRTFNQVVEDGHEGVVVRTTDHFRFADFGQNVAKMVRPHHVQSNTHWSNQPYVKNELRNGEDRGTYPTSQTPATGLPYLPEAG